MAPPRGPRTPPPPAGALGIAFMAGARPGRRAGGQPGPVRAAPGPRRRRACAVAGRERRRWRLRELVRLRGATGFYTGVEGSLLGPVSFYGIDILFVSAQLLSHILFLLRLYYLLVAAAKCDRGNRDNETPAYKNR